MRRGEGMKVSVGIFAYNEGGSIGSALDSVCTQDLGEHSLSEIMVVSFGSTDCTNAVVHERARRNPLIRLEQQPVCRGKAASVSHFLAHAKGDILVMMSGDSELRSHRAILPLIDALNSDPTLGIVGARHCVINQGKRFVAFAGGRVWSTLHRVSLVSPKISGDLMAIRAGIVNELPEGIINDDVFLEFETERRGFGKRYCPTSEVYIRIPETIADYSNQRRRIYAGHRQLNALFPHRRVSTNALPLVAWKLLEQIDSPGSLLSTLLLMGIDAVLRVQSAVEDTAERYRDGRWARIQTTKFPIKEEVRA